VKLARILDRIRLLPVLIGFCGLVLAMKIGGIAATAYAQAGSASETASPSQAPSQAATPEKPQTPPAKAKAAAATDLTAEAHNDASASEIDVLTSLSRRRGELDARAQSLDMREHLIAAAEKRVDGKIAALKDLQATIQKMLAARSAAEEKQIASLVKTYSAMKPRDAARIFDGLNDNVLITVAGAMKPDVLAPVLAQMQPDIARKVTMRLAGKLEMPQAPATPAIQQPATQQPAAQQPAATPAAQPAQPVTQAAAQGAAPAAASSGG
jgi:flagellar motility protein MotE (MotC chaperone)